LNPISGATLVSVTPPLSWSPIVSMASYTIQLSHRQNFDTVDYSKDTISTSIVLLQLQRSTTYYWRVRAQTIGDTTTWSSVSSFTTVPNAPNQITLVYPVLGKQDAYQNDWLTWLSDTTATSYLIQISQSPLFTTIYDSATVISAGYRSRNKVFTTGSTYFWRVRGSNIGGDGQYSSVWSFKVGNGVRVPITLYSSSNFDYGIVKVSQYKDTVVTILNNGNDTLKITSITSTNANFSTRTMPKNVPPAQFFSDTLRFSPSSVGTTSGLILVSSNALTSLDTIRVSGNGTLTAVDELASEIPQEFSLDQNYPNPFNPTTTISFSLPSKSFVSLKVFDALGRAIVTIVSEELLAGNYAWQWNANNLTSGVYFYRLQSGSFTETKKLILLRCRATAPNKRQTGARSLYRRRKLKDWQWTDTSNGG